MEVQDLSSVQAAHALLELAGKDRHPGGRRPLVGEIERVYELNELDLRTFEECFTSISSDADFQNVCASIMRVALDNRSDELVRMILMKLGEQPEFFQGQTTLLRAVIKPPRRSTSQFQRIDILDTCLRLGAPVDSRDEDDKTPLQLACELGYADAFRSLLRCGADPQNSGSPPFNLLEVTLEKSKSAERDWWPGEEDMQIGYRGIVLHLLDLGLRTRYTNPDWVSFFLLNCNQGNLEVVEQIHSLKVDIRPLVERTATGSIYGSAMHAAVCGGHAAVVRFLLGIGLSPGTQAYCGPELDSMSTPICYAISNGNGTERGIYEACELLIDTGVEYADSKALMEYCVSQGWVREIKRLIQRGVRLEEVPLCLDAEVVQLLYSTGARLQVPQCMDYALGCKAYSAPKRLDMKLLWTPSLDLVEYLHQKQSLPIERANFGEIAESILYKGLSEEGTNLLNYILDDVGYDIDTVFIFMRQTEPRCYTWAKDQDISPTEVIYDTWEGEEKEWPAQGELMNLLRISMIVGTTFALSTLLESGAEMRSIGMPHTTLVDHVFLGGGSGDNFRLLVQHSNDDVKQNFRRHFSGAFRQLEINLQMLKASYKRDAGSPLDYVQMKSGTQHAKMSVQVTEAHEPIHQYERLHGPRQVRLFVLEAASSPEEPITGRLQEFELPIAPSFEALSYVWGDPSHPQWIRVETANLSVTKSLFAALRRLRLRKGERYLWVDAICINQKDNDEKSRQVAMMGDIYRAAKRTLMWVGEHANGSKLLFKRIQEYYDYIDSRGLDKEMVTPNSWRNEELQVFEVFAQRPYFYRTWILQEIALAKAATVVCGSHAVNWEDILRSLHGYGNYRAKRYHPLKGVSAGVHAYHIRNMADNLESIFACSRHCAATNPKDKVYGILSLWNEKLISVDYNLPVEQIYRDFTEAVITKTSSLNPLHWLGTSPRQFSSLPSWVPDWSISDPVGCLKFVGEWKPRGEPDLLEDQPVYRFSGNALVVRGKGIDVIEIVGDFLEVKSETQPGEDEFLRVLSTWEQCALPRIAQTGLDGLQHFANALCGRPRGEERQTSLLDYLKWDLVYGSGVLREALPHLFESIRLESVADSRGAPEPCDLEDELGKASLWRFARGVKDIEVDMETICYGRRFFMTANGSMGLAPPAAREGDLVVFLFGGEYPFVIRPRECQGYELLGDCWLVDWEPDDEAPQEYTLL